MKALIDRFYSENYEMLIELTKVKIYQMGRDVCPVSMVSNSYLYLINRKNELKKEDIPRWAVSYINTELKYPRSVNLYTERKINAFTVDIEQADHISEERSIIESIDNKDLIEGFKTTLDRTSKIMWEVYADKGMVTAQELADHFGFSRTSAHLYKRELLDKFIEYVKTEERI